MSKDPNYLAKLEKAIKDKYGEQAIINPKSLWTQEDEKSFQEQKEKLKISSLSGSSNQETEEQSGFIKESKLITVESVRICGECKKYSFEVKDDIYMIKFGMCYKCYLKNEWTLENKKCSIPK